MSSPNDAAPGGALDGIVVLDLTRILAGPWCTQILADFGARVIKVERPGVGDDTRSWGPPWMPGADGEQARHSTYFAAANRNKQSVSVDIATAEGQEIVRALAMRADVLIENFKVGDPPRPGLRLAVGREPAPGLLLDHRLRADRPVCRPSRIRPDFPGRGRPDERDRRA